MLLLPYEEFEIQTNLKSNDVYYKLCSMVETKKTWWILLDTNKQYFGEVESNRFSISRVIWYRNSFLPLIIGKVHPNGKGSLIRIKMRLYWLVFIFMIFWLGLAGYMSLNHYSDLILSVIQTRKWIDLSLWDIIPAGMFSFGYLLQP